MYDNGSESHDLRAPAAVEANKTIKIREILKSERSDLRALVGVALSGGSK